MDKEDEVFELVDDQDNVIGTQLRGICHRLGLLHRAVYCWVFDNTGCVLIQRRSPLKKIGPNQWDLSVAEHLQPGEDYLTAAVRGLSEELGIVVDTASIDGPLQPTHRRELHQGEFHDVELVRSYVYRECSREGVKLLDGEVAEVRWVAPAALREEVEKNPGVFTRWMREEGASLGWFLREREERGVEPVSV